MNTLSDEAAIYRTIDHYSNGMRNGDVEKLRKAFFELAILCRNRRDGTIVAPIQELYDRVETNGTPSNYSCSVLDLEISGQLAAAKIRERDLYSEVQDDLHLAKVGDRWLIVSKVSGAQPAK